MRLTTRLARRRVIRLMGLCAVAREFAPASEREQHPEFASIVWEGGRLYALVGNDLMSSTEGVSWVAEEPLDMTLTVGSPTGRLPFGAPRYASRSMLHSPVNMTTLDLDFAAIERRVMLHLRDRHERIQSAKHRVWFKLYEG